MRKVLVIGYGNPGRLDDGLGPALAERIARLGLPGVTVESNYQLCVEDAAALAGVDVVVFADADASGAEPFSLRRLAPAAGASFSTHSVSPGAVLALARDLFGARAEAYVLGIRGYAFNEYGEELSEGARANLEAAAGFVEGLCRDGGFAEAASGDGLGRVERGGKAEAVAPVIVEWR